MAVPYTVNGPQQLMDIYIPASATGALPVVVYVHGGGWSGGGRGGVEQYAQYLTQRGYVFCSIDYRLSGVAKYPAQINDCKCAIRFLRANAAQYHIDPKHVGVWGGSAGGHLVALLGTTSGEKRLEGDGGWQDQSSAVQAVVDWYGPSDLRATTLSDYHNNSGIAMMTGLLGGTPMDKPELAHDASPMAFVAKGDPPFLIMHGDSDSLVPVAQSQLLYDSLKAAGNDATLKIIPGAGHGGWQFFSPENVALLLGFFDKHLKG
jgi:acetyl esterase/lipase